MRTAEPAPAKRQVIVVLGTHRSGTSALTGVLERLGATTPANQFPEADDNPRGFFESKPIARLNDRLLREAGRRWDDWALMPTGWQARPGMDGLWTDAAELLEQEFGTASLMAFKDPRLCRLFPFWADIFAKQHVEARVILTHRHPRDVAQSLQARNGISRGQGLLLWLGHVLNAEKVSRGHTRAITAFDRLMADPTGEMERMETALGQVFPVAPGERDKALAGFLEEDLRHHHTPGLQDLPGMIAAVYEMMIRWAETGEDPADYAALDEMYRRFRIVTQAADQSGDVKADVLLTVLSHLGPDASRNGQERRAQKPAGAPNSPEPMDAEVVTLTRLLLEAEDAAERLKETLAETRGMNTSLSEQINDLTRQKGQLAETIHALNREKEMLASHRDALEEEKAQLAQDLTGTRDELGQLQETFQTVNAENTRLTFLLQESERARLALENSTFWRISGPLRKLLDRLRAR